MMLGAERHEKVVVVDDVVVVGERNDIHSTQPSWLDDLCWCKNLEKLTAIRKNKRVAFFFLFFLQGHIRIPCEIHYSYPASCLKTIFSCILFTVPMGVVFNSPTCLK